MASRSSCRSPRGRCVLEGGGALHPRGLLQDERDAIQQALDVVRGGHPQLIRERIR
jgi:hypothetical protein